MSFSLDYSTIKTSTYQMWMTSPSTRRGGLTLGLSRGIKPFFHLSSVSFYFFGTFSIYSITDLGTTTTSTLEVVTPVGASMLSADEFSTSFALPASAPDFPGSFLFSIVGYFLSSVLSPDSFRLSSGSLAEIAYSTASLLLFLGSSFAFS